MAQPIPCDMCGEVEADFMVTNVHNGDTMGLGVECVGLWAMGIEAALSTPAEPEPAPEPDADPDTESDEPADTTTGRPAMSDAASVAMGADGEQADQAGEE